MRSSDFIIGARCAGWFGYRSVSGKDLGSCGNLDLALFGDLDHAVYNDHGFFPGHAFQTRIKSLPLFRRKSVNYLSEFGQIVRLHKHLKTTA